MLIDAYGIAADTTLQGAVCIVGSGAAGLTLAHELAAQGIDVVVLESGGHTFEPHTQELYRGEVHNPNHGSLESQRRRQLGGTTNIWGGRCSPFDPIDFEARPHVPHSGWPIGRADLDPYYRRAHAYCELGPYDYDVATALPNGPQPMIPGFDHSFDNEDHQDVRTDRLWLFSPPTNFRTRLGSALARSPSVRLVLHANCLNIALTPDGRRVDHLQVATLRKQHFRVVAEHYAVCTGALESARLLLASNDIHTTGVGNAYDLLGRFYMGHLGCDAGELTFPRGVVWNYEKTAAGVYCRRSIAISPEKQRARGLLNFRGILNTPAWYDPAHGSSVLSAAFLVKSALLGSPASRIYFSKEAPPAEGLNQWPGHLKNLLTDSPSALRFSAYWLHGRILSRRKLPSLALANPSHRYVLHFDAEQAPNPASRVSLARERDPLGMPRLTVDWRISRLDVDSVIDCYGLIADALKRTGAGALRFTAEEIEDTVYQQAGVGSHHIGTVRMATSPRQGMVDAQCRVFGVGNLFVASSAVFPTSSFANPTLTIVAIAIRLADHLKSLQGLPPGRQVRLF